MTEEQKRLKAERNKRYREKKKAAKLEKDAQAPIDPALESAMQAEIEKAPESAMQTPSNEKQPGQLLSDAAFGYYLGRQSRRK